MKSPHPGLDFFDLFFLATDVLLAKLLVSDQSIFVDFVAALEWQPLQPTEELVHHLEELAFVRDPSEVDFDVVLSD